MWQLSTFRKYNLTFKMKNLYVDAAQIALLFAYPIMGTPPMCHIASIFDGEFLQIYSRHYLMSSFQSMGVFTCILRHQACTDRHPIRVGIFIPQSEEARF